MQAIHREAKLSGHLGFAHAGLPENCAVGLGASLGTVAQGLGNCRKLF
jgi:hypothetical protein